ncbi:unnamed protein product [Echinostoma caproni]|uniref:Similar to n=1 Tax=Echinostoma caproni TaxID=27848 RepID=A0A183BDH2_9TREM|nr:unnamed protein product [Echinostoma caproni]
MNEAKRSLQRGEPRNSPVPRQQHNPSTQPSRYLMSALPRSSYMRHRALVSGSTSTGHASFRSGQHGSAHLQRHLGLRRDDLTESRGANSADDDDYEDEYSDSHIPDIEELEAADMLREAQHSGYASDDSVGSSSYEAEHYRHGLSRYREDDIPDDDDEDVEDDELIVEPLADFPDEQPRQHHHQRNAPRTFVPSHSQRPVSFPSASRSNQSVGFSGRAMNHYMRY